MTTKLRQDDFDKLIAKARHTNARRDAQEHRAGFAAPGDANFPGIVSSWDLARTAAMALQAGMKTKDWDCIAEGYLMIERISTQLLQHSDVQEWLAARDMKRARAEGNLS